MGSQPLSHIRIDPRELESRSWRAFHPVQLRLGHGLLSAGTGTEAEEVLQASYLKAIEGREPDSTATRAHEPGSLASSGRPPSRHGAAHAVRMAPRSAPLVH